MWLLSCDGDLFGGKRRWLRPGSTHLLGRTTGRSEAGERIQYIEHKSVSRKHLTIEIGHVKPGDGSKLHSRSEFKVKDGSKIGTMLNGEKLCQETRTLDGKEYTIKLGSYQDLFHIWWHPVTLSFTSASKKSKSDPLAAYREKLERNDIKLIADYVPNETSHVVSKKRNTTAVLQALLQARWAVTEGFVEALTAAVERQGSDGAALLEEDFEVNWPKEENYIVPSGGEPQPRPDEYLKPNGDRLDNFHDYVFVFLTQAQYDNLLPVITVGGGKAVLRETDPPNSSVEDVVEYVKEIAGKKGDGQFKLSQHSGKGGVVVVRANEGEAAWREFLSSLELALDQRGVQQNELLDTILSLDINSLRRQLPETQSSAEPGGSGRPEPRAQDQAEFQHHGAITVADSPPTAEPEQQQPSQPPPEEPAAEQQTLNTKNRYRRHITQSRFKGFDDFDPSQFSRPAEGSPEPSIGNQGASQAPSVQSMDVGEPSQPQRNSRKRPAPTDEPDEEDMYACIMTGHAAMKRQRMEAARNGGNEAFSKSSDRPAAEKTAKAKKKAKEMDVMAEVQARRQREDEQRRQDEEHLRQALEGVDIKDLKNLAQVEEMEVPVRERPSRASGENGRSDRWDPSWNGRKNFKKFRPQGQRSEGPRLQRVIVTLEEVPRKGHGLGDEYWLSSASTSRKSKSQSQSQTIRQGTSRSQRVEEDDEKDFTRFQRRLQNSREEDDYHADAQEVYPEEIAGHARDEALEAVAVDSTPSQTLVTESQRKAAVKRPATKQGGPPAKKSRQGKTAPSREPVTLEEDDDELKFRRRRR